MHANIHKHTHTDTHTQTHTHLAKLATVLSVNPFAARLR